MYSNILWIKC